MEQSTGEIPRRENISQLDTDIEVVKENAGTNVTSVNHEEIESNTEYHATQKSYTSSYSIDQSSTEPNDEDRILISESSLIPSFSQSETTEKANPGQTDLTPKIDIQFEINTIYSSVDSLDTLQTVLLQDMGTEETSALCKYRWTKTTDTKSGSIGFYPSYAPNNPILLSWDDKAVAYLSTNMSIVCGDYQGNLIIEGKLYPVEDFSVRSYTFEVDLFMKDDEMPASQSEQEGSRHVQHKDTIPVSSFNDFGTLENSEPYSTSPLEFGSLGSKVASHVEEPDGNHLAEGVDMINDEQENCQDKLLFSSVKSSSETSLTNMKRDSPVGNDDTGNFSEHTFHNTNSSDVFEKQHNNQEHLTASSEALMKSLSQALNSAGIGREVVEDVVRSTSRPLSRRSSTSETRVEARESLRGSRPPSIGADFVHGSPQSSFKHSQSMDAIYFRPHSKESDRSSSESLRNPDNLKRDSSKYKPTNEQSLEGSRALASPSHLIHATPSKERNSSFLESVRLSPRGTTQRELIGENSNANKGRIPENGEVLNTGSPLSARPPSHPGSRSGSLYPSRTQSLNSTNSDQELAQLFEHSRQSSTGSNPHVDSVIMKETERSSNIPNWATQLQVLSPSGEFLPFKSYPPSDIDRNKDVHDRSSSVSRVSTRASSRTTTPVPDNGIREATNDRIQELESSVTNLRKLLSSREAEVHSLTTQLKDLKDINRSLREELDHKGKRHTPVSSLQDSFEFKQLQSEKEILASEVVILRDELQRFNKRQTPDGKRSLSGSGIPDYSPHSPAVLQRKIADLEVHISDLQEVTETTNSSLLQAEKKLKILHDENKDLKSRSHNIHDHQNQSDHDLRVELRTLREDIHHLKERNYQLTEDNMRLMEGQKPGLKDISQPSSNGGTRLSSVKSDTAIVKPTTNYTTNAVSRYGTSAISHETSERRRAVSASPVISQKVSHEHLTPKEMRKSTLTVDSRVQESQLPQIWSNSDSSQLHNQSRNSSSSSKLIESLKKDYQYSDKKDYQPSERKDYQLLERKDYQPSERKNHQPSDRKDYQPYDRKDYQTPDRKNYQPSEIKDYQPPDRNDYQSFDRKDYQLSDRKDQYTDRKDYQPSDRKDYQLSDRKDQYTDRKDYQPSDRKDYQLSDRKDYQHVDRKDYQPSDRKDYQLSDRKDYQLSDRKDYNYTDRKDYQPSDGKDYQLSDRKDYHYTDRKDYQHTDRSKPDGGEVSDKFYLDKYAAQLLSYEKQSFEDKIGNGGSYLDKHSSYKPQLHMESSTEMWSRDKFDIRDKGDKYRHMKDALQDSGSKFSSLDRVISSGSAISSRDIFLNLQQKRANQVSQGERMKKLSSLSDDQDSDSTLALLAGQTMKLSGEYTPLSQTSNKFKEDKQREKAVDELSLNSLLTHDTKYSSGTLDFQRYPSTRSYLENADDDSDTATDILIGQDINSRGLVHRRRTSLGSDGSPSSLSDVEDPTDTLLRRRSKSTDAKRGHEKQVPTLLRSESASRALTSIEQVPRSVGFRSIIPAPLVTQHNKGEMTSKNITSLLSSSLTQGMRPFAPRSPADIRVDDVIKFSRLGGKLTQGVVKYVGRLPGRSEVYFGVELDKDEGKHDGTFEDIRYFKCKPNKGVFVSFNKVVMAWAP